MKKNILLVFVVALLFSSCKKDSNETCAINIVSVSGTYKLTALKYKASANAPETDWYSAVVEDCKKDDLYILNANTAFSIQDAGTVCSNNGSYSGTWTLSDNYINLDGFYSGTIESYNCKTLVFSETDALNTGDKVTATFTKQ